MLRYHKEYIMICIRKVWIILKNIYRDRYIFRSFVRTSDIFFHVARKEKKANTKNCSQVLFYRNNDKKKNELLLKKSESIEKENQKRNFIRPTSKTS